MHTLRHSLKLPLSIEECWRFFSSPRNLKSITPASLGFEIKDDEDLIAMYPGQIIRYRFKPLWCIPIEWVTEITHVCELHYFIDEQRLGPFKLWHHEHRFEQIAGGVLILDTVYYQLPLGALGRALNSLKIRKDLEASFEYRKEKLESLFGSYSPKLSDYS